MVIYSHGTTCAAPVADELRTAGFNVDVIGDAGALNCIHGAVHSAWKATAELQGQAQELEHRQQASGIEPMPLACCLGRSLVAVTHRVLE